ncbi:PREDICTED: uncharacterized protein LOC104808105 [Tarenaya hassleriana]|uniref:uncharacterized protein LOC104808105 n=1 Tax=Tarenaya hassleriana TaxID=28532 RepID=UPI00053C4402|nr:PREDICTED: uncharacterized protein LOC104808105 [Tarenaya hassleriana]
MEQPWRSNAEQETQANQNQTGAKRGPRKVPTPAELISRYQERGIEPAEASVKVIGDLQNALIRVVSSSRNANEKSKVFADASRKIDAVNGRLAVVEAKLDSKPGYGETFVLGLASCAGMNAVWPHVMRGFGHVLSAVKGVGFLPK